MTIWAITSFSVILFSWPSHAQMPTATPCTKVTDRGLDEVAKEAMVADVAKFCQEQAALGIYNSQSNFPWDRELSANTQGESEDPPYKNPNSLRKHLMNSAPPNVTPWGYSIYPFEEVRVAGWHDTALDFMILHPTGKPPLEDLKISLATNEEWNWNDIKGRSLVARTDPGHQEQEIQVGAAQSSVVCGLLTVSSLTNCSQGLKQIVDWAKPNSNNLILAPVWQTVAEDKRYTEALSLAALKVIARFDKGGPPGGHLFDDIKSSFIQTAVTDSEAEEMTWNTLAILSSAGANTNNRLNSFVAPNRLRNAINTLSYLPNILDSRSMASGRPYSYPKELRTTCDFGKPYHFWLTAYLARRLAKSTGDEVGAAAAAFTAQKAYEMRSRTTGRDPSRPFRVDTFDSFNNLIRMDLAFSGAGAWYGALAAKGRSSKTAFDVDGSIRRLVRNAKFTDRLDAEASVRVWDGIGLDGFRRWNEIFSPDTSFKYYEEQIPN